MNKAYVNVVFLIALNAAFAFFDAIDFFAYQPLGNWDPYTLEAANLFISGLIGTGIIAIGVLASRFLEINTFAMTLFTTVFWYPFITTSHMIVSTLLEHSTVSMAVAFELIFFTFMTLSFAWALIEMSSSVTIGG